VLITAEPASTTPQEVAYDAPLGRTKGVEAKDIPHTDPAVWVIEDGKGIAGRAAENVIQSAVYLRDGLNLSRQIALSCSHRAH